MKKYNPWQIIAYIGTAWYTVSTILLALTENGYLSGSYPKAIETILGIIMTFGIFTFGDGIIIHIVWIPVILGVFALLGSIFQKERTKAERITFALIPSIGAALSIVNMFTYFLFNMPIEAMQAIFASFLIIGMVADIVLTNKADKISA